MSNLSPVQFPLADMHSMYSSDFESKMSSVGPAMRSEYRAYVREGGGYDVHPKDIEHGGPDNYVSHLAEDIKKNGIREPIEVRGGNVVTQGHHRYLAAVKAGLTHVPVEHKR